jgi:hypothetical protein
MKPYLILAALVIAGCSSLPRYVPPPANAHPATIANYSNLVLCKLTGAEGADGFRACQARVLMIDGAVVPNATRVSIAPGERRISLFCLGNDYSYRMPGDATPRQPSKGYSQKYDVVFTERTNYKIEPFWEGGMCRVRLVDEAGRELPMKNVITPPAD